jgi:hypothetical protein
MVYSGFLEPETTYKKATANAKLNHYKDKFKYLNWFYIAQLPFGATEPLSPFLAMLRTYSQHLKEKYSLFDYF